MIQEFKMTRKQFIYWVDSLPDNIRYNSKEIFDQYCEANFGLVWTRPFTFDVINEKKFVEFFLRNM